ncbi:chitin synthase-domain-containing protein [Cyathus striatus]|nr:chitin synthase-domain-containing protein [Cyathus striatus]
MAAQGHSSTPSVSQTRATSTGDLALLISQSASTTVYPTDDVVLHVLQSRFRSDLPYARLYPTHLLAVNPYKPLGSLSDASAREYGDKYLGGEGEEGQPHVYDFAGRVYYAMRRTGEGQAVVARGITGSSKTSTLKLLTTQILRLSSPSLSSKLPSQIQALHTLLEAFGNAKTLHNPNASRHTRFLELHFTDGKVTGSKVLLFNLDKSRLIRLGTEERTYHVFYQFLAGATTSERDLYQIDDMSDYALLASSGCYRLPAGPFSDDSIAMTELRSAFRALGFKQKHTTSIFSLLIAILLLGNIQFADGDAKDVPAYVLNRPTLEHAARLLGVGAEELESVLVNKTCYVRREVFTILLGKDGAGKQRDQFVADLYAILVAWLVESINHRLSPSQHDEVVEGEEKTQIVLFDQPGFQTKGLQSGSMGPQTLLGNAYGPNGYPEFIINFADEMVHSYILQHTFEDDLGFSASLTADGLSLPNIATMDNGACVELLRGAGVRERSGKKAGGVVGTISRTAGKGRNGGNDHAEADLLQELCAGYGVHASFNASPSGPAGSDRTTFGINHFSGPVTYDIQAFIERDADVLDAAFVTLLRGSSEAFVGKLVAGPSLSVERHSRDEGILVGAQVSSRPLRAPTLPGGDERDRHPRLDPERVYPVLVQVNFTLSEVFAALDKHRLWLLSCLRPNDSLSPNSFDRRRVKAQLRALLVPDFVSRSSEWVIGYEKEEFCSRYVPTMRGSFDERFGQCIRANGWEDGTDVRVGVGKVWLTWRAWRGVEDVLRAREGVEAWREGNNAPAASGEGDELEIPAGGYYGESKDNLLDEAYGGGGLNTPTPGYGFDTAGDEGVWDRGMKEDRPKEVVPTPGTPGGEMIVKDAPNAIEEVPSSRTRRWWLWIVWGSTWLIPSFLLHHVGRMKRPDIRLAWREKFAIFWLILLLNGFIIFYIIEFGRLLCPNFDKAWGLNEVAQHQGDADFWVTIQGVVYDVSNFVHGDHSDITGVQSDTADVLEQLAGQDLTYYFPPPLVLACPMVEDDSLFLTRKNFTVLNNNAVHTSGRLQTQSQAMSAADWYTQTFLKKMDGFKKGPLVYEKKVIVSDAQDENIAKIWGIYENNLYDLTDYIWTQSVNLNNDAYNFLDNDVVDVFKQRSGQDITEPLNKVLSAMDPAQANIHVVCLKNAFLAGQVDFRKSARCQVQNYLLIIASAVIMASMALKFLSALQLGSKRSPMPCYTEDEDSLRRTIDSLAALNYDDKRKLIFIICDGNIIGSGNDRPTPRIVLDILGVDPKLDPEPLLFKSVGEGSKALNYGKVYSGLYEFEGHVVPYMVVVKVGKPTERSKPGNRGKRDSQILLMHYLNRVHFDSPMSPLELEIYHQMRNVIGIDPAFYEYIFTVDADTTVTPDSLNRLVASTADDSSIIGICGETKLENEEGSWWTMIQVYEYYISHHLSKAFESLFGSVTCLPGCFSLYRIRTADKGRPIIISHRIIDEYSEPNVDTLHKKNLFSLGEDRFLTTLLMKHFPTFKTKFCPDAVAHTMAPESWRVLFSQRRRWINSTVHNLCELVLLPELFGFCCFSMRFFVFIDLLGTLILPATVVYLLYLIIVVSTGAAAIPQIAIIMLAVTYGLQAIIFVIKREFMLVGWMVVYILSYPIYSFFLPVYSFWRMDEFGWGNTRLVIGEGKDKKVLMNEDEKFDESMIPLKKFSEYEAEAWDRASRHSDDTGYDSKPYSRTPRSRDESPHTYQQASQAGDYYRDTNVMHSSHSHSNLRHGGSQLSHSNVSLHGQPIMPQYAAPQLPFMPFGGGPGSIAGSDFGGNHMGMSMPGPMMYQNTGSVYGMMPPGAMMPNMNMFTGGSFGGSQSGGVGGIPPSLPPPSGLQQRMSTFSLATTVNPFAGPSMSTDPTDDELFSALRNYLSTQDLMTVTKKTAREAIMARFPKADLTTRKDFLNKSIDKILSES